MLDAFPNLSSSKYGFVRAEDTDDDDAAGRRADSVVSLPK